MMTTTLVAGRAVAAVGALSLALAGCGDTEDSQDESSSDPTTTTESSPGYGNGDGSGSDDAPGSGSPGGADDSDQDRDRDNWDDDTDASGATTTLGTALEAELLYLIEEEKLAHDVYITLDDVWDARVFENIAAAETTHTEAVETLLETYGIDDPRSDEIGVFSDASLQALYDDLTASGTATWADAVDAGIAIETTDIADLEDLLARELPADVATVVANLLKGSENHLAAFERQA